MILIIILIFSGRFKLDYQDQTKKLCYATVLPKK